MEITLNYLEKALGPSTLKSGEPTFDCPFCLIRGQSLTGHLHINLNKGAALCHSCDYCSRNLKNLIFQATGKLPKKLLRESLKNGLLMAIENIFNEGTDDSVKKRIKVKLPKEYRPLTFPPSGLIEKKCYRYLRNRGVDEELIQECQIGYGVGGRYSGMLIFPLYIGSRLRFFTTRRVLPFAGAKSLHAKVDRGGLVYNFNKAALAKQVIINEGPFDALSWSKSLGAGVATFGHKIHTDQARLLSELKNVKEFIVCFDSDCPDSTIESATLLNDFVEAPVSYIILKKGDPNSERKYLHKYWKRRKKVSLSTLVSRKFLS